MPSDLILVQNLAVTGISGSSSFGFLFGKTVHGHDDQFEFLVEALEPGSG